MFFVRSLKIIFLFAVFFIFSSSFLFLKIPKAKAQIFDDKYGINSFSSDITIEKDTTLKVSETIEAYFPDSRHGIYRVIPIIYSVRGKTLKANLKVESVTDEFGNNYSYDTTRLFQSVKIKIGDANKYVNGHVTYIITYKISDVIQKYADIYEIYWNVTGSEWDSDINNSKVVVHSDYASINKVDCFAGSYMGSDRFCKSSFGKNIANFNSTTTLGTGKDFSIVIGLDKDNQLIFSNSLVRSLKKIVDNWGYLFSFIPAVTFFFLWYKKGRDSRFLSDGIYFLPKDQKQEFVPIIKRDFLPTVYSPIDGLTPSQIGTILDGKVDIDDVVSEILELGRLGYIKIDKIETPKFLGKSTDYIFTHLTKDPLRLNDFQIYLLDSLFKDKYSKESLKSLSKLKISTQDFNSKHLIKLAGENKCVLLSSLKNNFYSSLSGFRDRLYDSLKNKVFVGRPDTVKINSLVGFVIYDLVVGGILIYFGNTTGNFFPLLGLGIMSVPGILFALAMPKRTAWGYSLYTQIKGLEYYLEKGKWRMEIAEKRMFFDEMLPLSVSLGIVNKLSNDMKDLGVEPPSYINGVNIVSFNSDIRNFRNTAATSLISTPKSSGSSSWSGGSGFSGGSSGGGFGGGGGGSW